MFFSYFRKEKSKAMKLSETWFVEGYIDFEMQQYRLLAYLKYVNQLFDETKLYPQLSDVIFHYQNLEAFRANKKILQDQFPHKLDHVNIQKLEWVYKEMLEDDQIMQELEAITQYALAQIRHTIENGTEIYDFVEKQIHMEPVGILPLYKDEGYMLLRPGKTTQVNAYTYAITLFEHKDARYRGVKMTYLDSWQYTICNTYEQIKREIIRNVRTLPNPAVFRVETELTVPIDETLLPVAKRMLIRELTASA